MLIKIVGAGLVFLSCTFLGVKKSKSLFKRERYLKNIKTALKMLEGEISYSANYLKKAFLNIWRVSETENLFYDAAVFLEEKNAQVSWSEALFKNKKSLYLEKGDVEVLNILSSGLGMSDCVQQAKNIAHIISLLDTRIAEAEKDYEKSSKLYRSMGVLAGVFFIILLL